MKEIKLINIYLKYLDRKDALQKEHGMSFETLESNLEKELSELSPKDLITLYFEYATIYNLQENKNIGDLLTLINEVVKTHFHSLSYIEMIDLLAFTFTLRLIPKIQFDGNIRQVQNSSGLSEKELKEFRDAIKMYEILFGFIETLYDDILIDIEYRIENINDSELTNILQAMSNRIVKNTETSRNIYQSIQMKKDQNKNNDSRFNNSSYYLESMDAFSMMEQLERENKIYETYQEKLLEKSKKK